MRHNNYKSDQRLRNTRHDQECDRYTRHEAACHIEPACDMIDINQLKA